MQSALVTIIPDAPVDRRRTFRDLPFIVNGKWSPVRTGDYATDCVQGREYAEMMIELMQQTQNVTIFGAVARAITAAALRDGVENDEEGVEVGFYQRIGVTLIV